MVVTGCRFETKRSRAAAAHPAGRVARRAHPRRHPRRGVPRLARRARRAPHQGGGAARLPRHHGQYHPRRRSWDSAPERSLVDRVRFTAF